MTDLCKLEPPCEFESDRIKVEKILIFQRIFVKLNFAYKLQKTVYYVHAFIQISERRSYQKISKKSSGERRPNSESMY